MQIIPTEHNPDETEPGRVVVDGAHSGSGLPDKAGEQVPLRDSPAPPCSEQTSSACSEPTQPPIAKPDPIAEHKVDDFVVVDDAATPPPISGSPGSQGVHSVGLQSQGSACPPSPSVPAPAAEQGKDVGLKEAPSQFRPQSRNQCPPGTLDRGEFLGEDLVQHDPSPTVGSEQSGRARSDLSGPATQLTSLAPLREEIVSERIPNIVVFGETGVGKSSIINLIADRKLAGTSNDAVGCTFQHKRYIVTLGSMSFALWDTNGLDEGSEGTVPAKMAERNLRELMRGLAQAGGIHLIIYCIRGTRLTKVLKHNYELFYVTVCRKKVPVALVVTGLEHQLGDMETWWDANEAVLRRYSMQFNVHACVTTLNVEDEVIQQRRSDSQRRLRELVVQYSRHTGWTIEPPVLLQLLAMFRNAFRSMGAQENTTNTRKVIGCNSFAEPYPGTTMRIGDRRYEYIWLDKRGLDAPASSRRLEDHRDAGLLIFYTTPVDRRISQDEVDALRMFYNIADGQLRPVIVALQGCNDEEVVRSCWGDFASRHGDIQAHLVALPSTQDDARANLDVMIDSLYVEHIELRGLTFFKRFMDGKCIREFTRSLYLVCDTFSHPQMGVGVNRTHHERVSPVDLGTSEIYARAQ